MDPRINQALTKTTDTKAVEVSRGACAKVGQMVKAHLGETKPVLLIGDERTWQAAGEAVKASLETAGLTLVEPLIFPGTPTLYAKYSNVERIREAISTLDATAVAIGSGTLNDLVKRAVGELEVGYAVVGTAASMDGYTGFGASISVDHVKVTMPCPAPTVIVIDLDVAAAAPPNMVASGFGDLIAKIPAGADWILADLVGVEPINPEVWSLVQGGVRDALSRPADLAAGKVDAYEGLVTGLVMSGLAMQVYNGTRPASGVEHYFSHTWEMEGLGAELNPPLSHGFKVGVGTLSVAAFYEIFLSRDFTALDIDQVVANHPTWDEMEAKVKAAFSDPALKEKAVGESKAKYVSGEELRRHLEIVQSNWHTLVPKLRDQLMTAKEIKGLLDAVGAPSTPEQIGLTRKRLKDTYPQARMFRSRFTVFDVALEAGWFDEIVEEIFAPGGFWAE